MKGKCTPNPFRPVRASTSPRRQSSAHIDLRKIKTIAAQGILVSRDGSRPSRRHAERRRLRGTLREFSTRALRYVGGTAARMCNYHRLIPDETQVNRDMTSSQPASPTLSRWVAPAALVIAVIAIGIAIWALMRTPDEPAVNAQQSPAVNAQQSDDSKGKS